MQADEVEARLLRDDAARVPRLAVRVEDRQIDPGEARARSPCTRSRSPRRATRPSSSSGLPFSHADRRADRARSGRRQILRLQPDQRSAPMRSWARLPADRRARPSGRGERRRGRRAARGTGARPGPRCETARAPVSRPASQRLVAVARELHRDLGARVAGADDQHAARRSCAGLL